MKKESIYATARRRIREDAEKPTEKPSRAAKTGRPSEYLTAEEKRARHLESQKKYVKTEKGRKACRKACANWYETHKESHLSKMKEWCERFKAEHGGLPYTTYIARRNRGITGRALWRKTK